MSKHIKKFVEFNKINELNMQTYAKMRDNTDLFPYTIMNQRDDSPRSVGHKKQRVNKLAGERFEQEFNAKYAGAQIFLENVKTGEKHPLTFSALRFINIGTAFELIFKYDKIPALWVQKQGHKNKRSYYISDWDLKRAAEFIGEDVADLKLADESHALLLEMVDFGV
jgi:hypothetical protein